MGSENIVSAVFHADELNIALTEEYGRPIYHYHLHVIAIPVVKKEIKYSKRCKDKSLVGKTKDYFHAIKFAPQKVANFFKELFDKEKQDELERQRIEQEKIQAERKAREEAREKKCFQPIRKESGKK